MPLKRGKSNKTVSVNIRELMHAFKRKGKIGNTKPKDKQKARQIAIAISLKKAGRSG